MKRSILFILLVALLGGGYYYASLRTRPEYALLEAAAAIRTHDMNAFERYVDVDALAIHLVDDVAGQSAIIATLVPGGGLALRSGLYLLKPQLSRAAHTEMQRYIENGSLEAAQAATPKRLVNLSFLGLAKRVISSNSKFKGIKYTTEKGDDALIGLEFTQPRYDTTMVVEVKLHKQADGHWRANEITNTSELLQQSLREEKQHLLK